ncbi:DUF4142 domain-containing protein [Streptomyces sp. NRRL F-2664]|uniref:DUF4142 domain-containing protein n=1 Tax=Streptomyces sp. NRRL F-2664 TaxID=1463842 RepID=UPI00068DC4BB|nr:DUF4142 domain-containing protein [Streptomyces sp. NRRL F-2664]
MSRWLTTAALVAALAGAGLAPAAAAPAPGSSDAEFVRVSHQGNLAEIAAGQDAQKHASSTCVKDVGAALVRDHTKLDAELSALAKKGNVTLPAAPTQEQQAVLKGVQAKAGSLQYDKAWLTAQEAAHTKTLALIDKQISQGTDAETTAAAKKSRPVVAMHLDMVRGGTCHSM